MIKIKIITSSYIKNINDDFDDVVNEIKSSFVNISNEGFNLQKYNFMLHELAYHKTNKYNHVIEVYSNLLKLNQLYGSKKEEPIKGLLRKTGSYLESTTSWTPRELLQYIGTDVMRSIDPDCWINVVKNYVETYSNYDFILISDGRFENEINWDRGQSTASKNAIDYIFKNGSKLNILAAT